MTLVQMQKISLVGLLNEEEKILDFLKKEGLLEIRHVKAKRQVPPEENKETDLAQIKSAINFIERFSQPKKTMLETVIPYKPDIPENEMKSVCERFDCQRILNKIRELDQEINNLHTLKNNLKHQMETLMPLRSLKIQLDQIHRHNQVSVLLGSIKIREHQKLEIDLRAATPYLETEVVDFIKGEAFIIVYYLKSESEKIDKVLYNSNFKAISLSYSPRTAAEELKNISDFIEKAEKDEAGFVMESKQLEHHKLKLMLLYDLIYEKQNNFNAKSKTAATRYSFIIEGWLRKSDLPKLKQRLQARSRFTEIYEIDPEKDEKPPVSIHNPAVLSPFELILNIFGTPSQTDIEPTLSLAPFFIIFFGICLSDAGYGILLILICSLFLRKLKLSPGGKKLIMLLFLGGIVTIPIGIVTGSYFGLSAEALPDYFLILKNLQLINPVKNPLTIMIISLGLGILQITFGLILEAVKKIRQNDLVGAILDDFLWICFLLSLVSLFIVQSQYNKNAAIIFAVLLVLTQGRSEKNIFNKFFMGLLSLYRTSGFMGDTLSYSRLLALMMSTSIIGMVINIIAGMVKDSVPILGYVFMIAILIFGHVFNLVVSTLSAFIHSMRLQLVEFFSKFFVGGGREFKPFRRETKYVNIIE